MKTMYKKFYLRDSADDSMAGPFDTEDIVLGYQADYPCWQGETVTVFTSYEDIDVNRDVDA